MIRDFNNCNYPYVDILNKALDYNAMFSNSPKAQESANESNTSKKIVSVNSILN